jgi:hypothetical protein
MSNNEQEQQAPEPPTAADACPKCGGKLVTYELVTAEGKDSTVACPQCGPADGATPAHEIPRRSEEELRALVRDFIGGRIFCSADKRIEAQPDLLPMVFMPLAFGAFEDWTDDERKQIGIAYEYFEKAGPRAVNGLPTFFSVKVLHIDDWTIVRETLKRELTRELELVRPT